MKRRPPVLLILLLLTGGAIVNVAVAWGFAVYPPQRQRGDLTAWRPFTAEESRTGWQIDHRTRRGIVRVVAFPQIPRYTNPRDHRVPGIYPAWSRWPARLDDPDGPNLPGPLIVEGAGWPALTLCDSWQYPPLGVRGRDRMGWTSAIALPGKTVTIGPGNTDMVPRALPLRPIWPGFAINTLFYAFVLWLLFAAPFVLRRWRRIKRGLCLKCGYDLRSQAVDSSVCPECGASLPR